MRPEIVAVATCVVRVDKLRILCTEIFGALLVHLCHLRCLGFGFSRGQLQAAGDDGSNHRIRATCLEMRINNIGHLLSYYIVYMRGIISPLFAAFSLVSLALTFLSRMTATGASLLSAAAYCSSYYWFSIARVYR